MDTDSGHISLDRLTLLLPPDIEPAFFLDQLASKLRLFKISLVVLFLSGLFFQYLNFGSLRLVSFSFLFPLPVMMLFTKWAWHENQIDRLSGGAHFLACAAQLSVTMIKPDAWFNLLAFFILLISGAVLFKIRYLYVALTSTVLVVIYCLSWLLFSDMTQVFFRVDTGLVFLCGGISVAVAYMVEYTHRMAFLKSYVLDQTLTDIRQKGDQLNDALIRANKSLELEIKAHTEAESQLRESEEKYRNLVYSIPDGIFIAQDQKIVFVNPSMERLSGHLSEELLGKDAQALFIQESTAATQKKSHDLLVRQDGQHIFIEKSFVEIVYNGSPALLFSVRDITKRVMAQKKQKQLEKELEQAKKMEAFGILAGGVAHDLNNVLSGLVSAPDALLTDLPKESDLAAHVQTIKESGQRAFSIADELLTMVRGSVKAMVPVHLNDVIEDFFLSPEWDALMDLYPDISIEKHLSENLAVFSASNIHMRKVVMNLISNAVEAAGPEKGIIRIDTATVEFENQQIKGYEKVKDGRYIQFSVMNTGAGILQKDIDHIFEPFYSKKVLGRSGTGLGLSIVWSAVHDHDGYIDVKSDEQNTQFTIYFPVSDTGSTTTQEPAKVYTIDDYRGQNENILVVDDLPEQQTIALNILNRLGYQVQTVSSGQKAIEYVRDNKVDLVVLDMVMHPGPNGLETFKQLLLIDPEIKAIITSGYSYDDDVRAVQNLGAGQFVKKPYTLESLGVAIKNEFSDRML